MKIRQAIKRCAVDDEEIRLSGRQALCCGRRGDQVVRSSRGNEDPSSDQALCCGRRGDQVVRRCAVDEARRSGCQTLSGRPEAMKIRQAIKRCAVDDEEIRLSDVVRSSRGNEDPSSDQAVDDGGDISANSHPRTSKCF